MKRERGWDSQVARDTAKVFYKYVAVGAQIADTEKVRQLKLEIAYLKRSHLELREKLGLDRARFIFCPDCELVMYSEHDAGFSDDETRCECNVVLSCASYPKHPRHKGKPPRRTCPSCDRWHCPPISMRTRVCAWIVWNKEKRGSSVCKCPSFPL